MKYGLPREEKPKKKWKADMENELRVLKMEVFFLKDQLDKATNKLTELSSKQSTPFSAIQDFPSNMNPFLRSSQNDSNNFSSTKESVPQFAPNFNVTSSPRSSTGVLDSSQENPFAPIERPRYQSTWDYDTITRRALRMNSISCMQCYKDNKSFEELRHEDYVSKGIGFSNQIQRFFKLRSSKAETALTSRNCRLFERTNLETNYKKVVPWDLFTTKPPPKAPWPFGPTKDKNKSSNSLATHNVALSESNTRNQSNSGAEQNKSDQFFVFRNNSTKENNGEMQTKNYSNIGESNNENLSSQVLLELRKMGEQISTVHDQLLKMDSNLSDVSSRVSVMDSRLSAVDMFVTMQRFDKKWQGLEGRLANLETPPPLSTPAATLPSNRSVSKDKTFSSKIGVAQTESIILKEKVETMSSFDDGKIGNPQMSTIGKSIATAPVKSIKNEDESLFAVDTTDINLSDFVRSISCTDTIVGSKSLNTSIHSDDSTVPHSPSKLELENASIEMADLKSLHSLSLESDLIENSGPLGNESDVSYSGPTSSVSSKTDDCNEEKKVCANSDEKKTASIINISRETSNVASEGNKQVFEPELEINSFNKYNNNGIVSNDPLGVIDQKDSSLSKLDDLCTKETENDAESEFVFVEKSDVEESLKENSKTEINEASSSSEFKMYSDITEYLEINLGKKKNLVYEFGFEAKPDYLLESEGSPGQKKVDETHENKAATFSTDDSFLKFKTNFIENKSVDAKQSSPFVFYNSKSPENPPDCESTFAVWMTRTGSSPHFGPRGITTSLQFYHLQVYCLCRP